MVPDLSPDESSGAEFSLILFSFSKECLTGNHHRSKNTRVPCTKSIKVLWSAQALGRAKSCKAFPIHYQGAMGPSSTLGSTEMPYSCSRSRRDRIHGRQLQPTPPRPGHLEFSGQFKCSLPFISSAFGKVSNTKSVHWGISRAPSTILQCCGAIFSGHHPWPMLDEECDTGKRAKSTCHH